MLSANVSLVNETPLDKIDSPMAPAMTCFGSGGGRRPLLVSLPASAPSRSLFCPRIGVTSGTCPLGAGRQSKRGFISPLSLNYYA